MKKALFLICAILFSNVVVLAQQHFTVNGYQYVVINSSSVSIFNYYNGQDTVVIPETVIYNGVKYTIVEIGGGAFMGKDYIVSVIIPSTVTSIGQSAFQECNNLTSVVMPNSITKIDRWAFCYCPNLTSFTIPISVANLGAAIFAYCPSLTTLNYNARDCNGFQTGTSHPFGGSNISTINIGDEVEKIPENFLYDMDDITTVNFSNNITHIGKKAFAYYDNFTTLNLPNNLTYIGIGAFESCNTLNSITIPSNVARIDDEAFQNCSNLNSVDFLTNNLTYIGDGAFKNCTSLTTFVVPNTVDSLGKKDGYVLYPGTFEGCSSLTKITLGKNLKYISECAFNDCTSLQTLVSLATIPPTFQYADNTFVNTHNVALIVGCDALPNYQNSFDWSYYFANNMTEIIYDVNVYSNDEDKGIVDMQRDCSTATLTATTTGDCFRFYSWSDGVTENPRIVNLESDTNIVAIFDEIKFVIDTTINQGEVYSGYGFNESEQGTYYQYFTTDDGCDSTVVLNLTLNVSLNDVEESTISLYPNPTRGEINFSDMVGEIEVMDMTGKIMKKILNTSNINIDFLPAGFYYLRLHYQDKILIRKVIKQ
jgi:hypothetical protein